jgi:hypothetical protein
MRLALIVRNAFRLDRSFRFSALATEFHVKKPTDGMYKCWLLQLNAFQYMWFMLSFISSLAQLAWDKKALLLLYVLGV